MVHQRIGVQLSDDIGWLMGILVSGVLLLLTIQILPL